MSNFNPRTERLHRKIADALRKHGDMTISQLRVVTGYSKSAVAYVLHRARSIDGVGFVRVGTVKQQGHDVYVYGLTERPQAPRSQQEILDRMARLVVEMRRLFRSGRRTEAMEVFETWNRLNDEFRQNAQNGQI